jgi:hypothetical protein
MPTFGPFTIQNLKANLDKLSSNDVAFATSLLATAARCEAKGWQLSHKQCHWLAVMAERATAPAAPAVQIGDMTGLIGLFNRARQNLKRPAITAQSPVGEIRLSLAGDRARHPGSINVAEKGRFGEATFYGRIMPDGTWQGRGGTAPVLLTYLKAFAANPAEMAAQHGHLTGSCCFCSRELTDARSVAVGYGPVCAANYGLPWGEAATVETQAA